jgi:predicted enzyme related to lactoylglutathione lyase
MPTENGKMTGRPNWADCCTTDLAGAEAFYASAFGWASERVSASNDAVYAVQRIGGKLVAGIFEMDARLRQMQVPPHWAVYFPVADLDAAVDRVRAAGGKLIDGPFDEPDVGRIAVIQDSVGAYLRLWRPAPGHGAEVFDIPGAINWAELMTDRPDEAAAFYADVLGTECEVAMAGDKPYRLLMIDGVPIAGILLKTDEMTDSPNSWDIYFASDDVDITVGRTLAAGGQVIVPTFDLPGNGRMAVLQDPQGAVFEVMKMPAQQTG